MIANVNTCNSSHGSSFGAAVNHIKMKFKFKLPAQDKSNKHINTLRATACDAILNEKSAKYLSH